MCILHKGFRRLNAPISVYILMVVTQMKKPQAHTQMLNEKRRLGLRNVSCCCCWKVRKEAHAHKDPRLLGGQGKHVLMNRRI